MASYNNFNDLMKALQEKVQMSMKTDVAKFGVEKVQEHVDKDVYSVYTPSSYVRTGALREDIQVEVLEDGIAITDERYDESKYIVPIIESGEGYSWNTPVAGTPRPFIEEATKEMQQTGEHVQVLKESLKRQGLNVK